MGLQREERRLGELIQRKGRRLGASTKGGKEASESKKGDKEARWIYRGRFKINI